MSENTPATLAPVAEAAAKFETAQDFIKYKLQQERITVELADGKPQVPLPVDGVEMLTGLSGNQPTLDIRIRLEGMHAVGEEQVAAAAKKVLSTIPSLAATVDFSKDSTANTSPGESTDGKQAPVVYSWGPDKNVLDFRFTGAKAADVVNDVLALREEELKRAEALIRQAYPEQTAGTSSSALTVPSMDTAAAMVDREFAPDAQSTAQAPAVPNAAAPLLNNPPAPSKAEQVERGRQAATEHQAHR